MPSRGRYRYAKQWEAFAAELQKDIDENRQLPTTFDECYARVADKVSGMYASEAKALWDILQKEQPKTIVEVGRNLGGTLYLMCCAAYPAINGVLSLDIEWYDTTDNIFEAWMSHYGIDGMLLCCDSTKFESPDRIYDFVLIDGLHTGEAVKADIECWKDHARLIGFHDFADLGHNKHKRAFKDVVEEIKKAKFNEGWTEHYERGRSEIVFRTRYY